MFVLAWLGGPFLAGAILGAALARGRWRTSAVLGLGVVIGVGVVVYAWLSSPLSSAPYDGCSDCGNYLGHWWEPQFAIFLVVVAWIAWAVGVGVGAWARSLARRLSHSPNAA